MANSPSCRAVIKTAGVENALNSEADQREGNSKAVAVAGYDRVAVPDICQCNEYLDSAQGKNPQKKTDVAVSRRSGGSGWS